MSMHQATPRSPLCVFCGSGPLTDEDVLPKWIQKVFAKYAPGTDVLALRDGKEWRTTKIVALAKRVCKLCNSGWLSRLENATIPILTPMMVGSIPTPLSTEAQRTLAIWALKTALTIDLIYPSTKRHYPPDLYRSFFRNPYPPDQCAIWTAAYGGQRSSFFASTGLITPTATPPNASESVEVTSDTNKTGVVCTFGILGALFQVFLNDDPSPVVDTVPPIGGACLWPRDGVPFDWPHNGQSIDDTNLDAFVNREITVLTLGRVPR